ncbi:FMN-dependent NADH-azoreductase [Oryzomonas sagensis]|uniref:FMN dependent NADH:quinone oxidoreductase n=1 Tax=Oryzomonas sagensis TaxID=2603857 RepID=A0ABQ6TRW1_9BACT|nr:FMN-dependent NADH-azoreductase [Oryzomonas sagensis]KAB0671707.1 FMN-dependent NADH-azoreductase [Oryzomonas sagensis]
MTKQILVVSASPRGSESASRTIAQKLDARLRKEFPDAQYVYRDLAEDHLPHLDGSTLKAITSQDAKEVEENREAARLSDKLTAELLASDLVVIATPMWNFGIPSLLKAWIDLVVRPGRTFRYAEAGVEGLARGKKAILVIASGGVFTDGPWKPWDYVDPYLRQILKFIGIEDVQTVRVEGLNVPPLVAAAIPNAERAISELALAEA